MPFVFNPLTGNLDYFRSSSSFQAMDYHSGFYLLDSPVEIESGKQMVNFGGLAVESSVDLEGQIILEN
jgi:hypothetical protein